MPSRTQSGSWCRHACQGGRARAPVLAGDWHLSRCMLRASHGHYPTVLPRRLHRRTFEHVTDHGRLHARVVARLASRVGLRIARDGDGYAGAMNAQQLSKLVHNTNNDKSTSGVRREPITYRQLVS